VKARRGDGTFGELIPGEDALALPGFKVARGRIATAEIGVEVKILAKAMIKQIDRVMTDLGNQVQHFKRRGGTPICVGVVGINWSPSYTSYEGDRAWPTDGKKYAHPVQEAAQAESRLREEIAGKFDEFLVLRFRATNAGTFPFEWIDYREKSQRHVSHHYLITVIHRDECRYPAVDRPRQLPCRTRSSTTRARDTPNKTGGNACGEF
jgi:hypothetical protein